MSQNSMRKRWNAEEMDTKLRHIMKSVYQRCAKVRCTVLRERAELIPHPTHIYTRTHRLQMCTQAASEFGEEGDLVVGANIAGFLCVAEAMSAQGAV